MLNKITVYHRDPNKKSSAPIFYYLTVLIIILSLLFRFFITNKEQLHSTEAYQENINMINELDTMMEFDKLSLTYEVHMLDLDGECFTFNVYFKNGVSDETDDNFLDTNKAIERLVEKYSENDIYFGYVDVNLCVNYVNIYLDLGSTDIQDPLEPIHAILTSLNSVSDIEKVLINESMDF